MVKKIRENALWIAWVLLMILISVWVLNHRLSIFELPESTTPTFDSYVKNDSWNTEFSTETPYKKGDILEYLFMFSGNSGSLFLLNTQNIATLLDEPTFELDGNPVSSISSLSVGEWPKMLRIRGKVKTDGTPAVLAPKALISVEKWEAILPDTLVETGTVNNKAEIPDTGMYDFQVSATHFSVNENALVKISGDSLSLAKMLIVGEQRFPVVISGKTGYTLIPRHTFAASEQFLGILMTNGKIHAFSEGVEFSWVKSEVFVRRITPSVVSSGEISYIVLQWYGFSKTMSLQLGNGFVFKSANFQIIDDTVMSVEIPKDLTKGTYTFNIMDTKWVYEMSGAPLTVK